MKLGIEYIVPWSLGEIHTLHSVEKSWIELVLVGFVLLYYINRLLLVNYHYFLFDCLTQNNWIGPSRGSTRKTLSPNTRWPIFVVFFYILLLWPFGCGQTEKLLPLSCAHNSLHWIYITCKGFHSNVLEKGNPYYNV